MIDIQKKVFYSWQSDLTRSRHQNFIEDCITKSIENFNKQSKTIKYNIDQATRDLPGSPDIVASIFSKIEKSDIFICDITPIFIFNEKKAVPNPNVLIELGYAAKVLGWENVICICNISGIDIKQLPFDINQKRIMPYTLEKCGLKPKESKKLIKGLDLALDLISKNQSSEDKVVTLIKMRLDYQLIKLINLFELYSEISGLMPLMELLKDLNNIKDPNIEHKKVLEDIIIELTLITRDPYLIITKGIDIEKIAPILELIDNLDITKEVINSGTKIEGFRKSTIATLINNIIDNWGINLTINPARI